MGPKKRRQAINKENDANEKTTALKFDPISIQSIINQNAEQFELDFQKQYEQIESGIKEKCFLARQEFEKFMQIHESQGKLAGLIDKQIARIHQQQQHAGGTGSQCQELLDKTADLMNASSSDTSWTKTYLIGELQMLPFGGNK